MDLAVIVGHLVHLLQEGIATGDHFVLGESVVGDIGVPAHFGAFIDFEESDGFEHRVWFRNRFLRVLYGIRNILPSFPDLRILHIVYRTSF